MTFDLRIHHITFILEATTDIHMGPQAGGQLRGSLWQALNEIVCTAPQQRHDPAHALYCPMCFLLELQARSPRGENPPRPFAIRPPLGVRAEDNREFTSGEHFSVTMTLMGKATVLFPYIVYGMQQAGRNGVGYGRGRFALVDIQNHNPLTAEYESLLDAKTVRVPNLAIQRESILKAAQQLDTQQLHLRFLTPTTIKHNNKVLAYPEFAPFIGRLLERCQSLAFHYGETSGSQEYWQPIYESLTTKAQTIRRVQDNTRQVYIHSGSRRSNHLHTINGFVGDVFYRGDLEPFLEWLVWGQCLQIGKNVIKGNGWYDIVGE